MIEFFKELIGEGNDLGHDFISYEKEVPFHIEPLVKGYLPYQDTTVTLRGYKDKNKRLPVRIKCKWFRVVDGRNYEIRDNPVDDTYHLNAYDVGSYIKVAVKAKGFKEMAILKIGPILMNPRLLPELEHSLLANDGLYSVKIMKVGNHYVQDESGHQNFIKFTKDWISLKFGFLFEEKFQDFKLQVDGPFDFKVLCENYNYRAISIFFKKGSEQPLDENILVSNPKKKREYEQNREEWLNTQKKPAEQIIFDQDEESLSNLEHKLVKQSEDGGQISQIVSEKPFQKQQDDDFHQDNIEVRVAFTSRLNRDAFVMALRIITTMRSIALAPLIDHSEAVFAKKWNLNVTRNEGDYNQLVGQMHDLGGAIRRTLKLNKQLNNHNDHLSSCVEALEEDLQVAFAEFKSLIESEGLNQQRGKTQETIMRAQQSMLETSMHVAAMKKGAEEGQNKKRKFVSTRKADEQKAQDLESEIEHTNKLNSMLLKTINQIKKRGEDTPKKRKNEQNYTMMLPEKNDKIGGSKLNRSLLGNEGKKDSYLIGLEGALKEKEQQIKERKERLELGSHANDLHTEVICLYSPVQRILLTLTLGKRIQNPTPAR